MERPAWLREEAGQAGDWLHRESAKGCGFWRRNFDVAVEVEDACADALLKMLERQLAQEEAAQVRRQSGGFHRH